MAGVSDPYQTLGVPPGVSDDELRAAYRRAVQRHHPDHNGGSAESARRFEEVQEAYARVRRLRASATAGGGSGKASPGSSDPDLEARLAAMERELAADRAERERAAKAARDRERAREDARRAAREAVASQQGRRPTDEELGYVKTDDSFSKILSDAVSELSDQLSTAEQHVPKRVADLIDELETRLGREPPER
jgi:curved DNA-binding protein CbpA